MNIFQAYVIVAYPILIGIVGAGALLMIKIRRRREATKAHELHGDIPADPLSRQDASRMWKRYFSVSGTLLVLLAIVGIGLRVQAV